jgi:hypothetical protein
VFLDPLVSRKKCALAGGVRTPADDTVNEITIPAIDLRHERLSSIGQIKKRAF